MGVHRRLKGEPLLETLSGRRLWASYSVPGQRGRQQRGGEASGGMPMGASVPTPCTSHSIIFCPEIYQMVFQTSAPLVPRAPCGEDAIINPSSFKGKDLTKATQLVNGGGGTGAFQTDPDGLPWWFSG